MNPRQRNSPGNPAAAVLLLYVALAAGAMAHLVAQAPDAARKAQDRSGHPVIEGWYADPEAIVYGRQYWIYPTYSDDYPTARVLDEARLTARQKRAINKQYPQADVLRRVLLRRSRALAEAGDCPRPGC